MSPNPAQPEENFDDAAKEFDLERLRADLEAEKRDRITDAPWRYFKGVLCGYGHKEIADRCYKSKGNVKVALSKYIAPYLTSLLKLQEDETIDTIGGWVRVPQLLAKAGYGLRKQSQIPFLAPPKPTYSLVGRDRLLCDLKQQLFTCRFIAFNGLPGVGKTALAIELANDPEVREQFPDGVLWAGLGRQPDILALLSTWATAIDIPQVEIARLTNIETWAQAIHTAIGMRRMLLVIDDAWQVEAALTLKLGGSNCAHLVTTRLPEIALEFAAENAIAIEELSENTGLLLLAQLAPGVVEAELDEAKALVWAVGGLPLALILMGKYLRKEGHSGQPRRLRKALEQLRNTEERLRLAQPQSPLERHPSLPMDIPLSLLAVIEISDEALDEASSHALYSLSVFPPKPNTFSEEAALAVCNASVEILDNLYDYGLLESSQPERYTLHHTISDYASFKLTNKTAFEQMVEFFISYIESHETDYQRFDLEITNILTALQVAFEQGMQVALVRGVKILSPFLELRGLYELAEVQLKRAYKAAKYLNDTESSLIVLGNLGILASNRGEYRKALEYYGEILFSAPQFRYPEITSITAVNMAVVATHLGEYHQAESILQDGLSLARQTRQHSVIVSLLANLGSVYSKQGKWTQAKESYQEALESAHQLNDAERLSTLLEGLGVVEINCREDQSAIEHLQESLTIARQIGYCERIISVLTNLSIVTRICGEDEQAKEYLQEGLKLARKTKNRLYTSAILSQLGTLELKMQAIDAASLALRESLEIALEANIPEQIAIARCALAQVAALQGNPFEALAQGRESLTIFDAIGSHKATEVKQWLTAYENALLHQFPKLNQQ